MWISRRPYVIMITYVRNRDPYVCNHDLVRTQQWSCTYTIMIWYVRNHDAVRTQYILYVCSHDPVHTQAWSHMYTKYIVRQSWSRTQSLSRTYTIMILYVRNHDPVYTYVNMIPYLRNYYPVHILNCFILLTYYAIIYQEFPYAYELVLSWEKRARRGEALTLPMYILRSTQLSLWQVSSFQVGGKRYGDICLSITDLPIGKVTQVYPWLLNSGLSSRQPGHPYTQEWRDPKIWSDVGTSIGPMSECLSYHLTLVYRTTATYFNKHIGCAVTRTSSNLLKINIIF